MVQYRKSGDYQVKYVGFKVNGRLVTSFFFTFLFKNGDPISEYPCFPFTSYHIVNTIGLICLQIEVTCSTFIETFVCYQSLVSWNLGVVPLSLHKLRNTEKLFFLVVRKSYLVHISTVSGSYPY